VPTDAHAYDVCYHNACYTRNVLNALRRRSEGTDTEMDFVHCARKVDFISCLSEALLEGKVLSMADVEDKYREICLSNGIPWIV